MAYHYTNSRSIPIPDSSADKFSTVCLYFDSNHATAAPGRSITNGFIVNLAQPLVLDISLRYVIQIIKASFNTAGFSSGAYVDVDVLCSIVEPQYINGIKAAPLLNRIYKVKYDSVANTIYDTPFEYQAVNPISRFINPTTKVISQMEFLFNVSLPNGTVIPMPPATGDTVYPTQVCVIIKQVPSHVKSITAI